MSIKW